MRFNQACSNKCSFLSQKYKIRWVQHWYTSSAFFHTYYKTGAGHLLIREIEEDNRNILIDQGGIRRAIEEFYNKKFSKVSVSDNFELLNRIPNLVLEDDNSLLCAIPGFNEIEKMVLEIDAMSSPGPDGFLDFFINPRIPRGFNSCFIAS